MAKCIIQNCTVTEETHIYSELVTPYSQETDSLKTRVVLIEIFMLC